MTDRCGAPGWFVRWPLISSAVTGCRSRGGAKQPPGRGRGFADNEGNGLSPEFASQVIGRGGHGAEGGAAGVGLVGAQHTVELPRIDGQDGVGLLGMSRGRESG